MNLGKTLIKLSFGLVMIYGVSFASQQTNSKVKIGYALAGLAAHYAGADAEGEEFAANLGATAGAAAAGYAGGEVGARFL